MARYTKKSGRSSGRSRSNSGYGVRSKSGGKRATGKRSGGQTIRLVVETVAASPAPVGGATVAAQSTPMRTAKF